MMFSVPFLVGFLIYVYSIYIQTAHVLFITGWQTNSHWVRTLFPHQLDAHWNGRRWMAHMMHGETSVQEWRATVMSLNKPSIAIHPSDVVMSGMWNLFLLSLFAAQHSIMARGWFKAWLTRRVAIPPYFERSIFILASTLVEHLYIAHWSPIPHLLYSAPDSHPTRSLLRLGQFASMLLLIYITATFDHWTLMGIKQCWTKKTQEEMEEGKEDKGLIVTGLQGWVRHPMMSAQLALLWTAPDMSIGRLFFNIVQSMYIFIAVRCLEEVDLRRSFGSAYQHYQRRTPAFLPTLSLSLSLPRTLILNRQTSQDQQQNENSEDEGEDGNGSGNGNGNGSWNGDAECEPSQRHSLSLSLSHSQPHRHSNS